VVRALERKRLVAKERSREDARTLAVGLTPRGEAEAGLTRTWSDFLVETVTELEAAEQEVRELESGRRPEEGFEGDDWGPGAAKPRPPVRL